MLYNPITEEILVQFREIAGAENVLVDLELLEQYAHDETEDLQYFPEVVVKPQNSDQISKLLKICNAHLIPVTPRGGGTGLSGAALPVLGGLLLSMEKFNRILRLMNVIFRQL